MRSAIGDYFYFRERPTFVVCTLILASCNDLKRGGGRERKGGRGGEEITERHTVITSHLPRSCNALVREEGWREEFDPFCNCAKMIVRVGGESRETREII